MSQRLALAAFVLVLTTCPAYAFEPILMKESAGANAVGTPCTLAGNTNGTGANYRWYNLCSGYIWIYTAVEGAGVLFGGETQPEVGGDNGVKRTITYWRNVVPGYEQTVDVIVNIDNEGDGCPNAVLATDRRLDPGLRWNCSDFDVDIPCGVDYLIVRAEKEGCFGAAPTFVTDGPFADDCDPNPPQRSYYYGCNASGCVPWPGITDEADNFLFWLILDTSEPCTPNATVARSWGAIKRLFR